MFARFNENPAMTLQDIKETKRYGRRDGQTHGRTHGQRENSLPPTNKVCGGYKNSEEIRVNQNISTLSTLQMGHMRINFHKLEQQLMH